MEILAHRGWWTEPSEKNSLSAVSRALSSGFGLEIDLRDRNGVIVVSHDPPRSEALLTFEQFLDVYFSKRHQSYVALNIKADGLASEIHRLVKDSELKNYFLFDMSIPDTLSYLALGLPVFTRRSEFETRSALDARADGLWLDEFSDAFVAEDQIKDALESGKSIALVSPELHRRSHREAWSIWRETFRCMPARRGQLVMICTDYPADARSFFGTPQDHR